jgi:iron complex outermembrane recepter protein
MSSRNKSQVLLLAMAVGQVAWTSARAQDETAQLQEVEEVIVTGSLLKREIGDVAQPITMVDAEDLIRSGATNAERILQQIAQNQSLTISNINLGAGTGGAAYANLRSLGSARTLVLVNGKRVVNNPFQSLGVDLNTIPMALIDRVEVLTDGGSATYGADAIAGVMNFITARDFEGVTLSASAQQPEASGGGETYNASLGAGYGSLAEHGWNVFAGVNWRKQEELPGAARDFARTGFIPERGVNRLNATTFPANYTQVASGLSSPINPTNPQCAPPLSLFSATFGARSCAYDQLAIVNQISPQEQGSVFAKGTLMLGEHRASLEYLRAENEVGSFISEQGVANLSMTSASPYFPGNGITPGTAGLNPALPIAINWRTTDMGRRYNTFEGYTDRTIAQLEGTLAGWDYQVSGLISTAETEVIFKDGYPDEARLRDGVAGINGAPFLNPFGPQSDAGRQFLNQIEVLGEAQRGEGDLIIYGAQASRDLWQLPAGPLALAVAVEFKTEKAKFINNFAVTSRVPSTFAGVGDITGERDSKSVALELNIPIVQGLEIGLSGRHDDYDDFGTTTNPEFSVRYEPFEMLTLRGSYSTGFRAPTLYDVFQPNTLGSTAQRFNDPVLCPGGVVNTALGGTSGRDCNVNFSRLVGGNRDLDPEESTALSVGFQLRPFDDFVFGIDYWEYEVEATIAPLSESAIFADPAKYADMFIRCSALPAAEQAIVPDCINIVSGDPLAYILNTTENLGETHTSGFDAIIDWSHELGGLGRLGLTYRGTYVSEYEFQREPGGLFFSRAGQYLDGSPVMRYAHFATLWWERGDWGTRLTNRHKSAYQDCNAQCQIAAQFFNEVEENSLWDVSFTYGGLAGLSLSLTVLNVLDEEPPFSNKTAGISVAFDDRYADPLLRTYLVSATYKF